LPGPAAAPRQYHNPVPRDDPSRTTQAWAAAAALVFAAAVLAFATTSSPLFEFNEGTDANAYYTMAMGWAHGDVPYRDLWDHKGPLLYLLYLAGYALDPGGWTGVYAVQVVALAASVWLGWRVAAWFTRTAVGAFLAAVAFTYFMLSSGIYGFGGGTTEEFCLPFVTLGVFGALVALRRVAGLEDQSEDPPSRGAPGAPGRAPAGRRSRSLFWPLAALGFATAAVGLIKFNLVAGFAVLLLVLGVYVLAKRDWAGFARGLLGLVAGALPLPALYGVYALATGSLGAFYDVYIRFNRIYAADGAYSLGAEIGLVAWTTWAFLVGHPVWSVLCVLGFALLFVRPAVVPRAAGVAVTLAWAVWFALASMRVGEFLKMHLFWFGLFGATALVMAGEWVAERLRRRWAGVGRLCAGLCCVGVLAVGGLAVLHNGKLQSPLFLGADEPIKTDRILAVMDAADPDGDYTFLNVFGLDYGLYTRAGQVPINRFFYTPYLYDTTPYPYPWASQLAAIEERRADFVVVAVPRLLNHIPDVNAELWAALDGTYELVATVDAGGDHLVYQRT
jgi:hypothetical protein